MRANSPPEKPPSPVPLSYLKSQRNPMNQTTATRNEIWFVWFFTLLKTQRTRRTRHGGIMSVGSFGSGRDRAQ